MAGKKDLEYIGTDEKRKQVDNNPQANRCGLIQVLPYNSLMGYAAGWSRIFTTGVDYIGVAFSSIRIGSFAHFLVFGVRQILIFTVSKRTRIFVLKVKS